MFPLTASHRPDQDILVVSGQQIPLGMNCSRYLDRIFTSIKRKHFCQNIIAGYLGNQVKVGNYRANLADHSKKIIKIQFVALGLVKVDELPLQGGGVGQFWKITDAGKNRSDASNEYQKRCLTNVCTRTAKKTLVSHCAFCHWRRMVLGNQKEHIIVRIRHDGSSSSAGQSSSSSGGAGTFLNKWQKIS